MKILANLAFKNTKKTGWQNLNFFFFKRKKFKFSRLEFYDQNIKNPHIRIKGEKLHPIREKLE